jgi:hypothetical protein
MTSAAEVSFVTGMFLKFTCALGRMPLKEAREEFLNI